MEDKEVTLQVVTTDKTLWNTLEATLSREPEHTYISYKGLIHGAKLISVNEQNQQVVVLALRPEIDPSTHNVILSLGMYGLKVCIAKIENIANQDSIEL